MTKTGLTILLASFFAVGCASNPARDTQAPDRHTAEIALDWSGTYGGVFPCADCEEIQVQLELLPNKTYKLMQEYVTNRPSNRVFETNGKFEFDQNNPSLIRLDDKADNSVYFVGEGYIEARDRQTGQPMSTRLNYKLIKK